MAAVAVGGVSSSNPQQDIEYSDKYEDAHFEYRHVILPKEIAKKLPNPARLLTEAEWRHIGVQQSRGWVHYEIHRPEPHILLFRRPLGTDPRTGKVTTNYTTTTSTNNNNSSSTNNMQILMPVQSSMAIPVPANGNGPMRK